MGIVSEHLIAPIAKQVEERSLVVWYDPDADYRAIAERLEIPGTTNTRLAVITRNDLKVGLGDERASEIERQVKEGKLISPPRKSRRMAVTSAAATILSGVFPGCERKIWIEQCETARGIEDQFGTVDAVTYLAGEK